MEKQKTRPVHEVTLPFGGALLKASIWRHQSGDAPPRFTVNFSRGYRLKDQSKWVFSDFFRRDELLGLNRVIEVAFGWLVTSQDAEEASVDSLEGGTANE